MSKLLFLDYFATGEGRTISVVYIKQNADEKLLLKKLEELTKTSYFNLGADFYNLTDLLNESTTDAQLTFVIQTIKEHVPFFYKQAVDYKGKINSNVSYLHHFNLA